MGKTSFVHGNVHSHGLDATVGLAIQLVQDLRYAVCESMAKMVEV
jgi:hypothetical protein